jgi:hypoxanthine phosphoribosyltransferase
MDQGLSYLTFTEGAAPYSTESIRERPRRSCESRHGERPANGLPRFRLPGLSLLEKEILFSRHIIQKRVAELAQHISSDYAGREPCLIGILNGVVFFFADLVREISIPTRFDFVRASSYGSRMSSSGVINLTKDVEIPIEGKPVLLVEDIVDTGLTLAHIVQLIRERNPESVRICALIDKRERRRERIRVDYCGFQIEQGFLVGYGLDYNEQFRNLPDIYTLRV